MEKRLLKNVLIVDESLYDDVFCLTSKGSYPSNSDFPDRDKGSFWCCFEDEVFDDFPSKFHLPYQDFCLGGYMFLTISKDRRDKFLSFCKNHNQDFIEVDICSKF